MVMVYALRSLRKSYSVRAFCSSFSARPTRGHQKDSLRSPSALRWRSFISSAFPLPNTSVNPARSTGPAIFVGGWALGQLWLFWLAPIVGALIAGFGYRAFADEVLDPTARV